MSDTFDKVSDKAAEAKRKIDKIIPKKQPKEPNEQSDEKGIIGKIAQKRQSTQSVENNAANRPITETFHIYGINIPTSEIKDYRIVDRDYVYRPLYIEQRGGLYSLLAYNKCKFYTTCPYAAVLSEAEYKAINKRSLLTGGLIANAAGVAGDVVATAVGGPGKIVQDIAAGAVMGVINTVGGNKKYYCLTPSGRVFATTLSSIPPLIERSDGRIIEPTKRELRTLLPTENTSASIKTIKALWIHAKVDYIFYGEGVQLEDVEGEYMRLHKTMNMWE